MNSLGDLQDRSHSAVEENGSNQAQEPILNRSILGIRKRNNGKNGPPKLVPPGTNFSKNIDPGTYFTVKFGPPLKHLDPLYICRILIFSKEIWTLHNVCICNSMVWSEIWDKSYE